MAHPLNRAQFDAERQRVTGGYGILQPRVAVSLPGTNRSRYARLFGSEPGIDPYTRAVSDVYQDLFGEGSFIGKGIYDVDAFERSLKGRFPENRILSHDLLEGCYARAGAAERRGAVRGISVQLQRGREPPPPLDPRATGRLPLAAAARTRPARIRCRTAAESAIGAVAMENLRQPAAQSGSRGIDAAVAAGLDRLVAELVLDLGGSRHRPDSALACPDARTCCASPTTAAAASISAAALRSAPGTLAQAVLTLACLPYEAYFSLDAILRTLWRMLVTRNAAAGMGALGTLG